MTTVQVKQVFVDDLGVEFDIGVEEEQKIHVKHDNTLQRAADGKLGINPATLPAGGSVAETAAGTVDTTIGRATGNAIRAISELAPASALKAADRVALYDGAAHVAATLAALKVYMANENIIEVNGDPNTAGTTFTPAQPQDPDVLYVNNATGQLWKWNGTSYVTYAPSASVVETPAGTVDTKINGVTGNAIRVIPELPVLAENTDIVNDELVLWNVSTKQHEAVPLNKLGLATISNAYYETVTAPATVYSDTLTLSHNYPQNLGFGAAWLHDGQLWAYGQQVRGLSQNENGGYNENRYEAVPIPHNAYWWDNATLLGYTPLFKKFWQNRYSIFLLDQNDRLWYRGWNSTNQCGIPAAGTGEGLELPTILDYFVTNNIKIVDVALSEHDAADHNASVMALDSTGAVWVWGFNNYGQLGQGTTNYIPTPTKLTALALVAPAVKMQFSNSNGVTHGGILLNNGRLYVSGANNYGQLGMGDTTQRTAFVQSAVGILDFELAQYASFYIDATGKVFASGLNDSGWFGVGSTANSTAWVLCSTFTVVANRIVLHKENYRSAYLIDSAGNLWVSGNNSFGQLGTVGTSTNNVAAWTKLTAAQAPFQTTIKELHVSGSGGTTAFVIDTSGVIWSAGYNGYGNRGLGSTKDDGAYRNQWRKSGLRDKVITARIGSNEGSATLVALTELGDLFTAGYVAQMAAGIQTISAEWTLISWQRIAKATGSPLGAATPSDVRIKQNIEPYKAGLKEILALRPVTFEYVPEAFYVNRSGQQVGLIAQEAEKVLPGLVIVEHAHGYEDFRTLDVEELTFTLIKAVQELAAELQQMKKGK